MGTGIPVPGNGKPAVSGLGRAGYASPESSESSEGGTVLEEMNRTPARDKSTAELARDLSDEVKRLIQDEFRLAAAEMQTKGKRLGFGVGLFGAAGLLAFFGGAVLIAAAVLALALVLPGWLARRRAHRAVREGHLHSL